MRSILPLKKVYYKILYVLSFWNLLNWKCCESNTFHNHTSKSFRNIFVKFLSFDSETFRHFGPKLVLWNETVYCTPTNRVLRMQFNKWSASFPPPTIPELINCESIVLFLRKNKYTNLRKFWTIFPFTKPEFIALKKYTKIIFNNFPELVILKGLKYLIFKILIFNVYDSRHLQNMLLNSSNQLKQNLLTDKKNL